MEDIDAAAVADHGPFANMANVRRIDYAGVVAPLGDAAAAGGPGGLYCVMDDAGQLYAPDYLAPYILPYIFEPVPSPVPENDEPDSPSEPDTDEPDSLPESDIDEAEQDPFFNHPPLEELPVLTPEDKDRLGFSDPDCGCERCRMINQSACVCPVCINWIEQVIENNKRNEANRVNRPRLVAAAAAPAPPAPAPCDNQQQIDVAIDISDNESMQYDPMMMYENYDEPMDLSTRPRENTAQQQQQRNNDEGDDEESSVDEELLERLNKLKEY